MERSFDHDKVYILGRQKMRKMLILIPPLDLTDSLGFFYERYALRQGEEVTGLEGKGRRDQKRYIELRYLDQLDPAAPILSSISGVWIGKHHSMYKKNS